jgi:hypothetical protein
MQMSWVVCGYYTPDYAVHALDLKEDLDRVKAPHDIVCVAKREGGWEANVRAKPIEIAAAMLRHPDKTIIWLDVDCSVNGRLDGLAEIGGDVAFFARAKLKSNGKPIFCPRSGTMVIRPTRAAKSFIAAWGQASLEAPKYSNDQDTMVVALGKVPNLSLSFLGNEACAIEADNCFCPLILHDTVKGKGVPRWRKRLSALVGTRLTLSFWNFKPQET